MALPLFFDPPARRGDDVRDGGSRRQLELADDGPGHELQAEHPDRPLLDALRSGDVAAFETLYTSHAAAVDEFVQGYVLADVAHDVVQDIFLTLWRRRTSVVIRQSFRAYLFGAARLRALQYRRNARTSETLNARGVPDAPSAPPDPAESAELRTAVAGALMTLPGRTRELLALRWVYGLSYPDAAAVLGVSPEAAKKLGRRAEVALAPLLERFRE